MTLPAPYPPLVSGGEGLDRYPGEAAALPARIRRATLPAPPLRADCQNLKMPGLPPPYRSEVIDSARRRRKFFALL